MPGLNGQSISGMLGLILKRLINPFLVLLHDIALLDQAFHLLLRLGADFISGLIHFSFPALLADLSAVCQTFCKRPKKVPIAL